jgi:UDP-N-acetylmuramate--alanine ligase
MKCSLPCTVDPARTAPCSRSWKNINLPYNGSGVASSSVTINKFETNKQLREAGLLVAEHRMARQAGVAGRC